MKKIEAKLYDRLLEHEFVKPSLATQYIHGCNERFYVLPSDLPARQNPGFEGWNKWAYFLLFDDDRMLIGVSEDISEKNRPLMAWHERMEYLGNMSCTTVFTKELEQVQNMSVHRQREYLQERTEFWQQLNRYSPKDAYYTNLLRCEDAFKRLK